MKIPASLLFFYLLFGITHAAEPLPLRKGYWTDSSFLKSFNGSYRINARIEPTVTSSERELLISIQKLMATGKRKAALRTLLANPRSKKSAAVSFNVGNIQFELGLLDDAEKSYLLAIKKYPNFRRAHQNLGFVYSRKDDWEKAIPPLEKSIQLGDQSASTFGLLAYGRLEKNQFVSALQAYRMAQLTDPENISWKLGVAQTLQHLEKNEEALALMDEVIKAHPEEGSYYILQASILLSMGRLDDAITNLELVRRLSALDSENHLLLATLHLRQGNPQLAEPLIMKALTMKPQVPLDSVLNSLEFLAQLKDWSLARKLIIRVTQSYGNIDDKRFSRLTALIDIDSGANLERGAKVLEAILAEDPLDAKAMLLLAKCRVSESRNQEAEMLIQQASRIEGFSYDAYLALAKLYVSQRRYQDSLKQLDKATELKPSEHLKNYRLAVKKLANSAE